MENRGPARGLRHRAAASLAMLLMAACHTAPSGAPSPPLATRCADFTIQLYFDSQSAALTKEARAVIDDAARRANRCQVTAIDVLGLSDAPGAADANLALSSHRAEAVTQALAKRGFSPLAFRVVSAGDAGAVTASGLNRPLRRRADVVFHLTPKS